MKLLAFFLALVIPAFGRLGETIVECDKRYGAPTMGAESNETRYYLKNGIDIQISFRSKKAVSIHYSAHPEWGNILGKLTDDQIVEFLKVTSVGGPWLEIKEAAASDSLFRKKLVRGDGEAEATWEYGTNNLTLTTKQEIKYLALKNEIEELEKKSESKRKAGDTAKGF